MICSHKFQRFLLLVQLLSVASSYFSRIENMQELPNLGFGTFRLSGRKGKLAVKAAIYAGYRHIDTAHMYKNESLVGEAISDCISEGVITREEIFIDRSSRLRTLN